MTDSASCDHPAELEPDSSLADDATGADETPVRTQERRTRRFALAAARLLHDLHCTDVLVLDIRGQSDVTDYILIASGTSDRQIGAVAQHVVELGKKHHLTPFGKDADRHTSWVVLDFVNIVVHLFEPTTRAYYDLEMMWGEAPKVRWRRPVRKMDVPQA